MKNMMLKCSFQDFEPQIEFMDPRFPPEEF